jgi:hypothetical protein
VYRLVFVSNTKRYLCETIIGFDKRSIRLVEISRTVRTCNNTLLYLNRLLNHIFPSTQWYERLVKINRTSTQTFNSIVLCKVPIKSTTPSVGKPNRKLKFVYISIERDTRCYERSRFVRIRYVLKEEEKKKKHSSVTSKHVILLRYDSYKLQIIINDFSASYTRTMIVSGWWISTTKKTTKRRTKIKCAEKTWNYFENNTSSITVCNISLDRLTRAATASVYNITSQTRSVPARWTRINITL